MKTINVNDQVRVKLTTHGEIILAINDLTNVRPNDDGELEMPLWELMLVFGPVMFHGNQNLPFDTEIELVRR